MATYKERQYIYIVQSSSEKSRCKIGRTDNLERRLKEYNNMTGKSVDNIYEYLFACEVQDMTQVEKDIKKEFMRYREKTNKEMYLLNGITIVEFVNFIKSHPLFIKEIFVKTEEKKELVKITTPSLKERGLSPKDVMQKAQKVDNDEFYTRYEDIEKEVEMYDKSIWKDKVVFCNCDDAIDDERKTSAFTLYFMKNFKKLKLQKLICTHYSGGIDIFNQGKKGYVYTYVFTRDGFEGEKDYPKNYDGSFDHPLSLKILNEEADIVCTNPPFSRAKEYWRIVIESGKKFLIISNITNVKNDAYIPYFIDNRVWPGYNRVDWFQNHKRQLVDSPGQWYTNLPIKDRPRYKNLKIVPLKEIPEKYKKYDDKKILVVDRCYIPKGYKKPFAVSVYPILCGLLEKGYKIVQEKQYRPYINGKEVFGRVLVQKV
jgi:predicted GIY-YIG superfamily endonuclease